MKRALSLIAAAALCCLAASCGNSASRLKRQILSDTLMDRVDSMAQAVAATGFSAGNVYKEVWIRDFNTFMELSLSVMPEVQVREALDTYFDFQGEDGNIPDAFVEVSDTQGLGYNYRFCPWRPNLAAHKNTVETDQESSLVQAVAQYVEITGNVAYLSSVPTAAPADTLDAAQPGATVLEHLCDAMNYLRNCKWCDTYGLITGATTADWGDVQPEHGWGVELDANTHYTIDIYDNAMFALALGDLARLCHLADADSLAGRWQALRDTLAANVRTHLWDAERGKYKPHIYLNGSPFPEGFDEEAIYYHGGTAVAALAGLMTPDEVAAANAAMVANVAAAGAQSIGLTLYPCYPDGFFANPMMGAWQYQNGGDWTWFGARMIQALVGFGLLREAYDELRPMLERAVADGGFYEWYHIDGTPVGSGTYRGAAGVLYKANRMLREAASE
ncbi:MAG: hypothetical protein J5693_07440 [Bacteroidales bacterium]|nr:hypothetical protein [Bacteroidales bacterium]